MKTTREIFTELAPELKRINKIRKRKLILYIPIYIIGNLLLFYYFDVFDLLQGNISIEGSSFWEEIILFIGLASIFGLRYWVLSDYKKEYKSSIIRPILNNVYTEVKYIPDKKTFPRSEITNSEYVVDSIDGVNCEDWVSGKIEDIPFKFAEVDVYEIVRNKNGTSERTLLEGLFFVADFPTHLADKIYINGKQSLSTLWNIFKYQILGMVLILPFLAFLLRLQILIFIPLVFFTISFLYKLFKRYRMRKNLNRVNLKLPIENNYKIYASSDVDAKRFFTSEVQKALIVFQYGTKSAASIHIIENKVYIFIPKTYDMFEPHVFRTIVDIDVIKENYNLLKCFSDIVLAFKNRQEF